MAKISVNKDFITEYRDEMWQGFTLSEIITLIVAGSISMSLLFLLYFKLGLNPQVAAYISVPMATPVLVLGFYKYQTYMPLNELFFEFLYTRQLDCLTIADVEPPIKEIMFSIKKTSRNPGREERR